MDLPKRKPNRLKGYDYGQSGAYFITICVKNRQKLLGKIVGGDAHIAPCTDAHIAPHIRLSKYGLVVDKYIRRTKGIDKYVIMPNHIHMIIIINSRVSGTMRASSPTQSIPQLVKSLKILTTKEIGVSLFQRSYHDHVIRNEKEYQQIWEYIDTNVLKWEEDKYYL